MNDLGKFISAHPKLILIVDIVLRPGWVKMQNRINHSYLNDYKITSMVAESMGAYLRLSYQLVSH